MRPKNGAHRSELRYFYWRSPEFEAWHANRAQISPAREIVNVVTFRPSLQSPCSSTSGLVSMYSTNAKVSTHSRFFSQIHKFHPQLSQQLRRQLLIYISYIYLGKFQDTIIKFLNNSLQIPLSGRVLNFQKSKTLNFCMGLSYNFFDFFLDFCSTTST
jgi:hypothetical protein